MNYRILTAILLFTTTNYAQKKMTKSFSTENIKSINFKLDQVYSVNIVTHHKPQVLVEAQVEGEHHEQIVLTSKRLFGALLISSELQPSFKNPNDKLSAHKAISIELLITVPENLNIYLKSDTANIVASGHYKTLTAELSNGYYKGAKLSGNAVINTLKGNIDVQTNYVTIEATSQNGKVSINDLTSGDDIVKLNTINGNITVTKSQ